MKAEAADDGGIDVPEEIVSTIGLTWIWLFVVLFVLASCSRAFFSSTNLTSSLSRLEKKPKKKSLVFFCSI
jgi:hypothetical protein